MFEDIDTLPGTERRPALDNGNRKLTLCESGADVRRHVVGAFHRVRIEATVLGHESAEEGFEIVDNVGISVLLDQERSRRVAEEDGEEAFIDREALNPRDHFVGDFVEAFASSSNGDLAAGLLHEVNVV